MGNLTLQYELRRQPLLVRFPPKHPGCTRNLQWHIQAPHRPPTLYTSFEPWCLGQFLTLVARDLAMRAVVAATLPHLLSAILYICTLGSLIVVARES
jgi:hypothetical protein